jgi:hypothetical protein
MTNVEEIQRLLTRTYGLPQSQWDAAKREALDQLIVIARQRSTTIAGATIAYSDLAAKIRSIPFSADGRPFHSLLGQISVEEHRAGRGMLSVLVVHKSGDRRPGPGFFELAHLLGHKSTNRDKVWSDEFRKVKAAWKTPS